MDSLITAAARALAGGDALAALRLVALRDDATALAFRGVAMAQLGEHARARELLRRAARQFGRAEPLARARCVVAEAEVALAMREFGAPPRTLASAHRTLVARGDRANAHHARLVSARRHLLLGDLHAAAAAIDAPDARDAPSPALTAVAELTRAEIAMRRLDPRAARAALARAHHAAARAGIPALVAEVEQAGLVLDVPAARCSVGGTARPVRLDEVADLVASGAVVVDACRHRVRVGAASIPLQRRPILFTLLRALADGGPAGVSRTALIARTFRARRPNETHRARLRVEIGRLRAVIAPFASVVATAEGFALHAHAGRDLVVLAPPVEDEPGALLALLADGAAWSTSALALALRRSQRSVQRELGQLAAAGRVRSIGRARARRWLAPPLVGITTILLLPAAFPPQ